MSDIGSLPPIDPATAEAATRAAEEDARRQAAQQGSSGFGDVVDVAADVLDLAGTVAEGAASVAGAVVGGVASVAGTVVGGVASAIGGLFDI